jgi:hypothetical protein
MTPPATADPDPDNCVATVLILYVELPETPLRASIQDRWQARRLYDRGISLRVVESAFLLASLRRLAPVWTFLFAEDNYFWGFPMADRNAQIAPGGVVRPFRDAAAILCGGRSP